ncbi:YaaA family protein [Sphingomicrobium astaxanthinifaciens]|uniref:YaaA family protein n=1 Tax=Sphingomicrobium astaxanthinifaciens TaxID=1227949 RepID=UPI001FCAB7D6|nr:YaaA family protein [Sphingomicrobium astaxanthinifaciens]MCJ7422344.1 YaaA family protein [Sphingomicrobium astaxanthinifaciens]
MLILLSPAKSLDETSPYPEEPTIPRFERQAAQIARAADRLSAGDLKRIMGISDKLAALNAERYDAFFETPTRPAIRTFAGDVYRGFDVKSADADTIAFAQDHVRILSGLYGMLRPLDRMRPYRLEMGTGWNPAEGEDGKLTDHWGDTVAKELRRQLREEGSMVLLNLASNEYYYVVRGKLPKRVTIVEPDFRVRTAKGLQFQSFAAKVARGSMARWVCDERVDSVDALANFNRDGWAYDADGSSENAPLFVREG